jgi:threonine aldolase
VSFKSDFRSDTVTRPSPAMREAMASAEVGDDVLDGDPTVERLQELAAGWLGKEGALFVPSGTMANQVAVGAWTRPGDEIVVERGAHVVNYEGGAAGYLHGVQTRGLVGDRGALAADEVRAAIQPTYIHCPRTALVCVEQTHMGAGGRVVPLESLQAVHRVANAAGIPVHLDGARLANAVVASGISARDWAAAAESVSVCLSKGLGAPVGSVIAGDGDFLERAAVVRKRLGGWMRQAGVIAAAGLVALEENVERLAEDHALAKELALRLGAHEGLTVPVEEIETNLVMVRVSHPRFSAVELAEALGEQGIGVLALGPETLRFVTHLDVGPEDVERLDEAIAALVR